MAFVGGRANRSAKRGLRLRQDPPVRDRDKSIWQSAKAASGVGRHRRPRVPKLQLPDPAHPPSPAKVARKIKEAVARYSTQDWRGWALCGWDWLRYTVEARFPQYNGWSARIPPDLNYGVIEWRLPPTSKILMIGDWGTHMTDNVALLRQALKTFAPDIIIHLGDVYYSGTRQECVQNVIEVLDAVVSELKIARPPFFTLPGNHDYYSGGRGFYEMIGRINADLPGCEQKASYFCLRTVDDHWQFLGMDTGFHDRRPIGHIAPPLEQSEVTWHRDKLDHFPGTTILLSHHQLYSAKERLSRGPRPWLNETLHAVFQPYYDRVAAWFWGHEHNLIIFKDDLKFPGDTAALRKGRLIGCSAYEETVTDDPFQIDKALAPAAFRDKMPRLKLSRFRGATQRFYNHAFAMLDVSPLKVTASYYEYPSWDQNHAPPDPEIGEPIFTEELPLIRAP
jgi:hypothetical protein